MEIDWKQITRDEYDISLKKYGVNWGDNIIEKNIAITTAYVLKNNIKYFKIITDDRYMNTFYYINKEIIQ